ncbi:MAG: hypothetical protein JWM21_2633 [Acidobacteria bacterium]|nr:hypothetical protein [Acidobacteriota bacterium]
MADVQPESAPEHEPNAVLRKPTSAARALREIKLPDELVGSEPGQLYLTFETSLSYVKVQFTFNIKDIGITCNGEVGEQEGLFEFSFNENEERARTFEIGAVAIEKESRVSIDISCKDADGKLLGAIRRYKIKLRPANEIPDTPTKLLMLILSWKKGWYIKYPVLVLVGIGLLLYFKPPTEFLNRRFGRQWKYIQIEFLGKPPERWVASGIDPLKASISGKPDPEQWDAPVEWTIDSATPFALNTVGDGVGVIKVSELTALYDYKILLNFVVTSDDQRSAIWLLRVQESKKDYYLFRLTFPTANANYAQFQGFIYEDGKETRPLLVDESAPLEFFPFHRGNVLWINIEAKGNTFAYRLYLANVRDPRDLNMRYVGEPTERIRTFTDTTEPRFPYGVVGFKGENQQTHMKIISLKIYDIH